MNADDGLMLFVSCECGREHKVAINRDALQKLVAEIDRQLFYRISRAPSMTNAIGGPATTTPRGVHR